MKKRSKKYKEAVKLFDAAKTFKLEEALAILKKMPQLKLNQSVDLHVHLNIDTKKSDQLVRGTVVLPHGTGKSKRIAVFCKGEAEKQAKEAGADFVGAQDLIDKVNGGWLDFDVAVATPEMMKDLSKLGKVLGPRGLMPSPKAGTVTQNVTQIIKELKAGKVEFKTDKQGGIHLSLGRIGFDLDKLTENASTLLSAIKSSRPASIKGIFIKSLFLSTTMSPGLRITA